jgi:hypothetical protein
MKNYFISSVIKITRSKRNRVASFTIRYKGGKTDIHTSKTDISIQALLANLEKSYQKLIYSHNYTYDFPLRKDEIIPERIKPETFTCDVTCCSKVAKFHNGDIHSCPTHFYEAERTSPVIKTVQLPKRNELCNCGSGKKYKRCCISKVERVSGRLHYNQ